MTTPISMFLLVLTVAASLIGFNRGWINTYALSPYQIARGGRWTQLFTSGFLHADFTHLLFNMITLYYFGPPLEGVLGGTRFLIVYFGSMLAGSLLSLLRHRDDPHYRAVGASGAISGVLFGFILFAPMSKIFLFLIPIGIPAVIFAVGYVAISVFGMKTRMGRIGHDAHLGGALGGALLTILLYPAALRIFLSHF